MFKKAKIDRTQCDQSHKEEIHATERELRDTAIIKIQKISK